jgi:hypothetical protein
MAEKYKRGKNWIRAHLGDVPVKEQRHVPQPIVAIADVTFFKRDFGVCVIRAPHYFEKDNGGSFDLESFELAIHSLMHGIGRAGCLRCL